MSDGSASTDSSIAEADYTGIALVGGSANSDAGASDWPKGSGRVASADTNAFGLVS